MGDIVLTSPVLRLLKTKLKAEVSFLTKSKFASLLEHNPNVDQVFVLRDKVQKTIVELKKEEFDLIIDLHKNIVSFRIKLLLGVSSLTYDKKTFDKIRILKFRNTSIVSSAVAERYIEALSSLGVVDDGLGLEYHGSSEVNQKDARVTQKKKIVIVIGGTYFTKRIPTKLVLELVQNQNWYYQLLGGTDVDPLLAHVENENCYNGIGELSWHESASLIQGADLVITGDTGLMHVAAAYQKPVIVIWGSTASNFGFYPYYGSLSKQRFISIEQELSCRPCSKYGKANCPLGHMNCLNLTKASEVFQAIETLLG